jgi:hypothetical protein
MIRLDEALRDDQALESLPEVEALLLRAAHDLATTLSVEPQQVLRTLATVIRRRVDFERLRHAAKAASARSGH